MPSWNNKYAIMSKSATHEQSFDLRFGYTFLYPVDSFILEATKVQPSGDAKRRATVVHAQ